MSNEAFAGFLSRDMTSVINFITLNDHTHIYLVIPARCSTKHPKDATVTSKSRGQLHHRVAVPIIQAIFLQMTLKGGN